MTEQQTNDFALWFEQFMDPELNLTPGDKELCQHAWQAALSHAERREFQTEQDLISFLDGLYETAGPDSSALTGQKWAPAQRAIEGIRSHAEGEAVPVGYLSVLSDGTRIVDARQQYDAPEVWPLYTHPAPQVAGLTETAIKSSPAYRALHREKEHLLGLLKDQAPQVAVPEGWKLVPVEPTDKMMLRGGFSFAGKMPNELVYPAVREVWDRLLSEVPDAPTAPAGEPAEWPEPQDAMTAHLQDAARKAGYQPHELNMQLSVFAGHVMAGMIPDERAIGHPGGLGGAEECPECGSTVLEWGSTQKGPADVVDGRLRLNEVESVFVLGCTECSETVRTMGAHEVCRMLSAPAEREIAGAIKALELVAMRINSEVVQFGGATANETGAKAAYRVVQNEIARLRAGKEGESHA